MKKKLGKNLRRIREEHGLTQEAVSIRLQLEGCDITRSALAKMEAGQRHIYPDEIKLLKKVLDIEYSELLDFDVHE